MAETPLHWLTISELSQRIRNGVLSPVELTEHLLSRLEALDGTLHAFKLLTRERALAQAQAAELALRAGQDVGPLHGIPYAVKDLFDVRGLPTTAGSNLYGRPALSTGWYGPPGENAYRAVCLWRRWD